MRKKRVFYFLHFFILAVGISCGSATAAGIAPALVLSSSASIHTAVHGLLLKSPFKWYGLIISLLYAFIDYAVVAFLPLVWLLTLVKGFAIGFSAVYLVTQFGFSGVLALLAGVVPIRVALCALLLFTASEAQRRRSALPFVARQSLIACAVSLIAALWLPLLIIFIT